MMMEWRREREALRRERREGGREEGGGILKYFRQRK